MNWYREVQAQLTPSSQKFDYDTEVDWHLNSGGGAAGFDLTPEWVAHFQGLVADVPFPDPDDVYVEIGVKYDNETHYKEDGDGWNEPRTPAYWEYDATLVYLKIYDSNNEKYFPVEAVPQDLAQAIDKYVQDDYDNVSEQLADRHEPDWDAIADARWEAQHFDD